VHPVDRSKQENCHFLSFLRGLHIETLDRTSKLGSILVRQVKKDRAQVSDFRGFTGRAESGRNQLRE